MATFCDGCEAVGVGRVAISGDEPYDDNRTYCETCKDVYFVGLQHGRRHEAARYGVTPGRESASQKGDKPIKQAVQANRQALLATFTAEELQAALASRQNA